MIDVATYPDHHGVFAPVFICSTPPASQDLFNPVYEELSEDRGETDSEGMPRGGVSEDEFAEDEDSLPGEAVPRRVRGGEGDSSDADDNAALTSRAPRRRPRRIPPPLPPPLADCNDFHEGFLLKKILQIYPDVTGVGLQYSRGPEERPGARYESLDPTPLRRPKPEIFSTFRANGKNQSQESSLGSDSGYSNNTSGGKPRREYKISSPVLS